MSEPSGTTLLVAGAADSAYALPLAVMLRSAVAHLAPEWRLEAHIVDDGLAERERAAVESSVAPRCVVHWASPGDGPQRNLPLWGRMPRTTYQKLRLGEWLPAAAERALWLDCDLLVLADLARLWRQPLGGQVALAAQDLLVPRLASRFGVAGYRELGLAGDGKYFNAGVLLLDLARWRNEGIAPSAADYLARFGDRLAFWDQEALNAALAGRWGELDPRWNRNPGLHRLFGGRAGPSGDDAPWIVHFSGRLKPWNCPGASSYQSEFDRFLDETAWAGWRPPRSWRGALLARYSGSPLRRITFPLEQWWTVAVRALTRRRER